MGFVIRVAGNGPAYNLVVSNNTVTEGQQITLTLYTTYLPVGTVIPYTIDGIDSNDLVAGTANRQFVTQSDGTAVDTFIVTDDDLIEGTEIAHVFLTNRPIVGAYITILDNDVAGPTYNLTSSSYDVAEGESITITLTTTNIAPGTSIPFRISTLSGPPVDAHPQYGPSGPANPTLDGTFTIGANGVGTATINTSTNTSRFDTYIEVFPEGGGNGVAETFWTTLGEPNNFRLSLYQLPAVQPHIDWNITDTSPWYKVTPDVNSLYEGQTASFVITAGNVSPGTEVSFHAQGTAASNIPYSLTHGTVYLDSSLTAQFSIPTYVDSTVGDRTLEIFIPNTHEYSYEPDVNTSVTVEQAPAQCFDVSVPTSALRTRSTAWTSMQHTTTFTFGSSTALDNFFLTGGYISWDSGLTGTGLTTIAQEWQGFLNDVSNLEFRLYNDLTMVGGANGGVGVAGLTNVPTVLLQEVDTQPNYYNYPAAGYPTVTLRGTRVGNVLTLTTTFTSPASVTTGVTSSQYSITRTAPPCVTSSLPWPTMASSGTM